MPNNNNRNAYNNNSTTIPQGISLQAITSFDDEAMAFLFELYASTRLEEISQTPWNDEEKLDFLNLQFTAQHTHYQNHYPHSDFQFIVKGQERIGRLYVDTDDVSICLIDITLSPELRGQGIGTKILKEIMTEAQDSQKKITIHVENFNPAYQWYLKHGFKNIEDKGVYQYMEWHPSKT